MVSDIERTPTNSTVHSDEGYEVVPSSKAASPAQAQAAATPDSIAEGTMNLRIGEDEAPKEPKKDENTNTVGDNEKSRHRGHGHKHGRRGLDGPGGFGGRDRHEHRGHRGHRGHGGPPPGIPPHEFIDERGPPPPGLEGYYSAFFGPRGHEFAGHHFGHHGFGPHHDRRGPRGPEHRGDRKHKNRHARAYSPPGAGWEAYKSDGEARGHSHGKHHARHGGPQGHRGEGHRHGHKGPKHGRRSAPAPEAEVEANDINEKIAEDDIEVIDVSDSETTSNSTSTSTSESESESGQDSDLTPSDQERFDKFLRFHRRAFGHGPKHHGDKGHHGGKGKGEGRDHGPRGHPGPGFGRFPPAFGAGPAAFDGDRRRHRGPPPASGACGCGDQGPAFDARGLPPFESHFGRRGPPAHAFGFGFGFGPHHGHGRRGPPPHDSFRSEHFGMRGPPPACDEDFGGRRGGYGGFGHRGHGHRGPHGFGGRHQREAEDTYEFEPFGGPSRAYGPEDA